MSVELHSPKTGALARELANATGEDIETAVERALEERLARLATPHGSPKSDEIDVLFDRLARMPVLDQRSAEEIIGYGPNGVPI